MIWRMRDCPRAIEVSVDENLLDRSGLLACGPSFVAEPCLQNAQLLTLDSFAWKVLFYLWDAPWSEFPAIFHVQL